MELRPEITAETKKATDPIYKKVSKVIPQIEWMLQMSKFFLNLNEI